MGFVPENNIKVSVSIITYNHEKFIGKAIDSVLNQKVDFKYEIIIGDDCSSDNTREIIKKYQKHYPDIISLILHPRRYKEVPGRTNNITNLYACQGKYIALLDGDDYWINENKLQTQINFLDKELDYSMSFHNAMRVSEENKFEPYMFSDNFDILKEDSTFDHEDVTMKWFVPTSSIVFRNNIIEEFPTWFWKVYRADYALLLLLSQQGKLKYYHRIFSVWLKNSTSFTSKMDFTSIDGISLRLIERKIFREHFPLIKEQMSQAHFDYMHSILLAQKKSYFKMVYYSIKCIANDFKYINRYLSGLKKSLL